MTYKQACADMERRHPRPSAKFLEYLGKNKGRLINRKTGKLITQKDIEKITRR